VIEWPENTLKCKIFRERKVRVRVLGGEIGLMRRKNEEIMED